MKEPKYDFDGRVALVTGSGAGIGQAIAIAYAHQGASVVVSDINVKGGEETVRRIQEENGIASFYAANVSNENEVKAMVEFAVNRYGKLDFACNNAGMGEKPLMPMHEFSVETWNQVLSVNLTGVFFSLRYEIKQMLKQGIGAIVNIASVGSLIGSPGMAAYSATKHGVVGLTRTASLETVKKGVRVNAVAPGLVNAGLTDSAPKEFIEMALAAQPIGRMAETEEIASAVLWLCSDAASFVTGHTLVADGGMTVQ